MKTNLAAIVAAFITAGAVHSGTFVPDARAESKTLITGRVHSGPAVKPKKCLPKQHCRAAERKSDPAVTTSSTEPLAAPQAGKCLPKKPCPRNDQALTP